MMNTPNINKKNSKKTQKVTKTPSEEQQYLERQYQEELQINRYIYDTLEKTQKVTTTLSHEPLSEEEQQYLMNLERQYQEELQTKRYIYDTLEKLIDFLILIIVPVMILIKYRFTGIIVLTVYYIWVGIISLSFFGWTSGPREPGYGNHIKFTILYFTLLAIIYRFTPTP